MPKEEAIRELENWNTQMDNLEDLVLVPDPNQQIIDPTEDDILDLADTFEVNLIEEPFLRTAIRNNLTAKTPENWQTYSNKRGQFVYWNT